MASLIPRWESEMHESEDRDAALAEKIRITAESYGGLKDVEDILTLVILKFKITLLLINNMQHLSADSRVSYFATAREKVHQGKIMLEDLFGENLSDGETDVLKSHHLYGQAQELFQEILIAGGVGFFEGEEVPKKKKSAVAKAMAAAVKKYASPDDQPHVLFQSEKLSDGLRSFMRTVFPNLGKEDMALPPYGIPEGEEEEISSDFLVMPLSQGILYMEEELLPKVENALLKLPGDEELQSKKYWIELRITEWKKLKFLPRSTPVLQSQDYYTHGISQYTDEGEPLVRFAMPVKFSSGTNLDRQGELIRDDIVRRLAGKGWFPDLDKEYSYRKSLDSGRRGNSRIPSFKINLKEGFSILKEDIPSIALLENKEQIALLIEDSKNLSRGQFLKKLETRISRNDEGLFLK